MLPPPQPDNPPSSSKRCLAAAHSRSYLHGFARRLTKFSQNLTIDIFHSFLTIYMKCCDESENMLLCFSTEKSKFSESMGTKIRLGNTMCLEHKERLRALIFYAKLKPVDAIEKAMDFNSKYMDFVFKCCNPGTMSSECFDTWSGVLLTRICLLMDSSVQKNCCFKNDPERENCLIYLANEESKYLPPVSLEPKEICQLSTESKLLTWLVYEYARRNPNDTITSPLIFANNLNKSIISCCTTNDASSCLSDFIKHFTV
uniref:Albumin domain-containing protein n=1 Tax=Leptobrachium leishanense TaxID=445787 RepID=A0A8C5LPC8_9ANUR